MNPVLSREVLERFGTRRAPWFIFGWTVDIAGLEELFLPITADDDGGPS
jgi:hypothetical protein